MILDIPSSTRFTADARPALIYNDIIFTPDSATLIFRKNIFYMVYLILQSFLETAVFASPKHCSFGAGPKP